jgi:3-hydroxyisobutyrate dehydrogenase-like beta-hydroxyacid dehydrogenase
MTAIALLGLGEVGTVLAEDIGGRPGVSLSTWDVAFADPDSIASANAARLGLTPGADAVSAVRGADLVISAVTAANDLTAARSVLPGLAPGAWFLDLNSAAPAQKQATAEIVAAAGGRYVEAAVMSPINPKRLGAPMLLGGAHAAEFVTVAEPLGFTGMEPYADVVGPASATKLCRSVMIKGVEALLTESMLAAREWGVQGRVLASLSNLLPSDDWEALAAYMISRSLRHGARRAEEMREAAATVAGAGVAPLMSEAIARRQDWAAAYRSAAREDDLLPMLDQIRAELSGSDGSATANGSPATNGAVGSNGSNPACGSAGTPGESTVSHGKGNRG